MNEQQLQQLMIQQAIAAAAAAALFNSLLNPQQAAGLQQANANALTDSSNDIQQQQQQQESRLLSPTAANSPASSATTTTECNNRIQDLLAQLQQQAASGGQAPLNLNLSNAAQQQASSGLGSSSGLSPVRSPISNSRLIVSQKELSNAASIATTSNTAQHSHNNQASPIKRLKKHHHQQAQQQPQQQQLFHNRSTEATSKPQPQHPTQKHHSSISNRNSGNSSNNNNTTSSSSSSSAFIPNNVGLPRKLVRGQDVWLGRGAEQTRQILKCMWCGQSFRTLAEMTQHMKITQHYTNIISQEQITSWRQPETSESNSKPHTKQTAHVRSLDDNTDDLSEKFNDSDREESFSNEDDLDQIKHSRLNQAISRVDIHLNKSDSNDNNSTAGSLQGDGSPKSIKGLSSSKPLTRSRRRETETLPMKREVKESNKSPTTSSSSQQQRQNSSSNLVLAELNEENNSSDAIKDIKPNGNFQESMLEQETKLVKTESTTSNPETDGHTKKETDDDNMSEHETEDEDNKVTFAAIKIKSKNHSQSISDSPTHELDKELKDELTNDQENDATVSNDEKEEELEARENDDDDDVTSETNESAAASAILSGAIKAASGQKGDTGDPLSALETMVEKSFDPRLRPGVANGGILQRLGIDEEVCPPWQHINYANWYAAAAYGHPMAAALLAAGINLQNGIKLSKNVDSKKNEE